MDVHQRIQIIHTIREVFDVIVHINVVNPGVVLQEWELVGHADDCAAQFSMHNLEVLAPKVFELLHHLGS